MDGHAGGSHVFRPGVKRSLYLPLDDWREKEPENYGNPVPPGSHVLFAPPPFIASLDVVDELIFIRNPAYFPAQVGGWVIQDEDAKHTFHFPADYTLPPRTDITRT